MALTQQSETTGTVNYALLSDLNESVVKEVIPALTANTETRELIGKGSRKRSHPHQYDEDDYDDEMDEDSLTIDGNRYEPLSYLGDAQGESYAHSSATISKSDNMTDLFPAKKSKNSTVVSQNIDMAEEILGQVVDDSIDS